MDFFDFGWIASPDAWATLLALSLMEIVLGVDNIVFISILTGRLPEADRPRARQIGLALALIARLALLFCISWVMSLEAEWFVFGEPDAKIASSEHLFRFAVSGKGIILLGGGLFLLW